MNCMTNTGSRKIRNFKFHKTFSLCVVIYNCSLLKQEDRMLTPRLSALSISFSKTLLDPCFLAMNPHFLAEHKLSRKALCLSVLFIWNKLKAKESVLTFPQMLKRHVGHPFLLLYVIGSSPSLQKAISSLGHLIRETNGNNFSGAPGYIFMLTSFQPPFHFPQRNYFQILLVLFHLQNQKAFPVFLF